jgi:hypothetical protein
MLRKVRHTNDLGAEFILIRPSKTKVRHAVECSATANRRSVKAESDQAFRSLIF